MKEKIDVFEHACTIMKALEKGVLLTTKAKDKVNTMTISWGTLGYHWGKPVFVTFVRKSRYTAELLMSNPEFTINIPYGEYDPEIFGVCGVESGRDIDKISKLHLSLEEPEAVSVPGIREFPLTLECRVIFTDKQDITKMSQDVIEKEYPDVPTPFGGTKENFHYAFYGEIISAYLIK